WPRRGRIRPSASGGEEDCFSKFQFSFSRHDLSGNWIPLSEVRQMVTRPVPESEWKRSYREDYRIISDDLWNRVQTRRALRRQIGTRKLGGLERTKRSEKYLFSGLLCCGVCDGSIRIIDTDSETVRYGCGTWRDKGACTNATRIRRDRLEEQLLAWLTRDL